MQIDVESEDEDEPVNKNDDEEKENMVMVEGGGPGEVPCEYLQSRAQNMEIVRNLSAELRDEFEILKDSKKKKPASKKKGKKVQNERSVRRQSQKNKDRWVFSDRDKSFSHSFNIFSVLPASESARFSPQDSASTTVIVDESASTPAGGETTTPIMTPTTDPTQLDPTPALTIIVDESASSTLIGGETATPVMIRATDPTQLDPTPAVTIIIDESASSAPAGGETTTPVTTPAMDPIQLDPTPALTIQSDQLSAPSLGSSPIPSETTAPSGMDDSDAKLAPPHTSTIGQTGEGDVVTGDAISNASSLCGTSNAFEDDNLPAFLAVTIEYLQGASAEGVWQDLVTTLVAFEKSGPPSGVRLTFTCLASFK